MNPRMLRLSALIALAYSFSVSPAGAQTVAAPALDGAGTTPAAAPAAPDATQRLDPVVISSERLDRAQNGISVETGSSVYHFGRKDIDALPQGGDTPFNQLILQAPGAVQDSYGQLHVRGDHANLQYRLNGILLPESISGFGQTFAPRLIDRVNLITGAVPAQYGDRTAGVIDVHTKTGKQADGGDIG